MSTIVQSSREGRVLRFTLNRPEKRNALNAALCRDLVRALEAADRDSEIGAILLNANGPSFCAGMDLKELDQAHTHEIDEWQERLFTIGSRLTKPLVAAVRGAALGGGMGLVANCHVVIAGKDATFGLTEIRLGLWPFLIQRAVAAALGERRTVELALTGRIFAAEEARTIGLAHEMAEDPEGRAGEIAAGIAAYSPTAIRSGLIFVQQSHGADWRTAGEMARRVRAEIFATRDFQEGVRAFREKRRPKWPSLE